MQHPIEAPHGHPVSDGEVLEAAGDTGEAEETRTCEVPRLPGIGAQLIGERIRAMYTRLIDEPVPDRLLMLIRELEKKERPK